MDFDGHGTHVSGIIAGRSKWYVSVPKDDKDEGS
jgi:subtilisin family serine protease